MRSRIQRRNAAGWSASMPTYSSMWNAVTWSHGMSCSRSASTNANCELPVATTTRACPRASTAARIVSAARSAAATPISRSEAYTSTGSCPAVNVLVGSGMGGPPAVIGYERRGHAPGATVPQAVAVRLHPPLSPHFGTHPAFTALWNTPLSPHFGTPHLHRTSCRGRRGSGLPPLRPPPSDPEAPFGPEPDDGPPNRRVP